MELKDDIFATSKGRWDFAIALIVIVLFSGFIYYLTSKPEAKADDLVSENEIIQSETLKLSNIPLTNSEPYQTLEIDITDDNKGNSGKAIVLADFKKEELDDKIESNVEPVAEKNTLPQSEEQLKKETDSVAIKAETRVPVSVSKAEKEVTTEQETTTLEKDKQLSNINSDKANYDCVVVVGVFRNPENMKGIVQKLQNLGYEQRQGILREGLTYIGVPVACDQQEKKQLLLKKLNGAFKIDSWVKKK